MDPQTTRPDPAVPATVALLGQIDIASAWRLRDAVLGQPTEVVVLDLSGVTFMDAAGVRALLEARDAAAVDGRRVVVHRPSACVRRLLAVVGLIDALVEEPLDLATSELRVVDLRDRSGADEDRPAPPRR